MIYIKLEEKPKTIEELLTKFFSYLSYPFLKSVESYEDKECMILNCYSNRFRSIDDVIELVRTYFPRTRDTTIFKKLFNLRIIYNDDNYRLRIHECTDIRKPTVCFYRSNIINNWGIFKSTKMTNSKYANWSEIAKKVGINSLEELQELYK